MILFFLLGPWVDSWATSGALVQLIGYLYYDNEIPINIGEKTGNLTSPSLFLLVGLTYPVSEMVD